MELLPIIYVSLAIFAVVAIVTITTSFISYKIRAKAEGYKKPYEKEEDPSSHNYMKKKIMDSDGKFHTVISDADHLKKKDKKKHSLKKGTESKKETHAKKHKTGSSDSRIKILNQPGNPPPPKVKEDDKNKKPEKDLKNIKEDIINKYTDEKGDEFFSPKISSKKRGSDN